MPWRRLSVVLLAALVVALVIATHREGEAGPPRAAPPRGSSPARVVQLGGRAVPLYPVSGAGRATHVGFTLGRGTLTAVDQQGRRRWSAETPGKPLIGGFDYDQDGWTDAGVVLSTPTAQRCGSSPLKSRSIRLYSGRTGRATTAVSPKIDYCYPGGTVVRRWSELTPLFGSGRELVFAPQYDDQAWVMQYSGGDWHQDAPLYLPTGPWWDATYSGDPANVECRHHRTDPHCVESHILNGLVTTVEGETRLIAWTTRHVMQFRLGEPLGASQLAGDHSYISHCQEPIRVCGPPYIAGRNYGLVARDPESGKIALLAGPAANTVFKDIKASYFPSPRGDPYGQLERHVSIYDPSAPDEVDDRPYGFSNFYTPDWRQYWGRLVYPANPFVSTGLGASRLAYNVYSDLGEDFGHWYMQISMPGSTDVQMKLRDRFLWDIRDIDGDGTAEWITSPVRDIGSSSYLPTKRIQTFHWDEAADRLSLLQTIDGVYPYLARSFRTAEVSTSQTYLFPVLSIATPGGLKMLVTSDGTNFQPAP